MMGQNDVENFMARKQQIEERELEKQIERAERVHEPQDDRQFVNLDNLDEIFEPTNLSESTRNNIKNHLKFERGVVWLEDGAFHTKCPVCQAVTTIGSIHTHLNKMHQKGYVRSKNELDDYTPRGKYKNGNEIVEVAEPEPEPKKEDVFDELRRLHSEFPNVWKTMTGEQIKKMIAEAEND